MRLYRNGKDQLCFLVFFVTAVASGSGKFRSTLSLNGACFVSTARSQPFVVPRRIDTKPDQWGTTQRSQPANLKSRIYGQACAATRVKASPYAQRDKVRGKYCMSNPGHGVGTVMPAQTGDKGIKGICGTFNKSTPCVTLVVRKRPE